MESQNHDHAAFYSLIMAGGSGTRFWPESTAQKPKQYLDLAGGQSLLESTLIRFEGLIARTHRFIVTVRSQEMLARSCSKRWVEEEAFIWEPMPRNTAPCVLLSLVHLLAQGAKLSDVCAIVPSDHMIADREGFQSTFLLAKEVAIRFDRIVTIGVKPTFAHTGYGYICRGEVLEEHAFAVREFKEKPSIQVAKEYLSAGCYYWNAGMFVCTIGRMLEELRIHAPEIYAFKDELQNSLHDYQALSECYKRIPSDSIDYAVMEKSRRVAVVPATFDWNDLGSWDALEGMCEKTNNNTLISMNPKHYISNARGNIVRTSKDQMVTLIDVSNLIIINHPKSLVILPKKNAQKIKQVVEFLREQDWGDELL